jgi:voltage-gated potassium channel
MTLKERLHEIVFEAETPAGKAFDLALLYLIVLSIVAVSLETVDWISEAIGVYLLYFEWLVTILFSIEYILRVWLVKRPSKYIFSFWGIIDLVAILPTYLSVMLPGTHSLIVVRVFRLLRVFRILKLVRYSGEATLLFAALWNSRHKIFIFLGTVLAIVITMGTLMYLVEGEESGFTSIPKAIYWSIVTITTVGYGDIAPQTVVGQMIASFMMIVGYAIIAVPTGVVGAEVYGAIAENKATNGYKISNKKKPHKTIEAPDYCDTTTCSACTHEGHRKDARYCFHCGERF